jgi:hypothetical protein
VKTKICSKCKAEKPISQFNEDNRSTGARTARKGYGVTSACKKCLSEKVSPGISAEREKRDSLKQNGLKICGKCKLIKPVSEFHKRLASIDKLAAKCKACVNQNSHAWRLKHPSAHQEWYQKKKEHKATYFKNWRSNHKETEPLRMSAWAKNNPAKITAKIARRHAAKFRAMPKWANADAIEVVYAEAARLKRETGLKYEVDHIVPLQSSLVCGLHCEANLQILLKSQNIAKHNRVWPGKVS